MNEKTKGIYRLIDVAESVKETAVQHFDEDAIVRIMQLDDAINETSKEMTDMQKAVFVRRCILRQSFADIAEELDISPSTASYHVSTTLSKLANAIEIE